MNPKIKEAQEKFITFQKNLRETVISENNEISVTLDGDVQITSLKIAPGIDLDILENLLINTINNGIKSISRRMQERLMLLQQDMS
jgi:DNA-binding protein YbaB